MSERQGRTLRDDVRKSANKIFQKWKKEPNKSGSSSVSKSTQEKTNYSRLCRLLISIGSRVLRGTFDSIIPPENLRECLKRDPAHSRLQLLRKKGVLSSVHWSKLYVAIPTEVSSANFDIPLLIVLLRTICNLSPPPAGWDTPPLTADTSRESDIARIKYFMNAVSKHATEGSLSDSVFSSYWHHIRDTLVRLGGADYGDVIDEMKDQDIEFLDGEHFRELLKQWKKVEDEIKDKLNEVLSEKASQETAVLPILIDCEKMVTLGALDASTRMEAQTARISFNSNQLQTVATCAAGLQKETREVLAPVESQEEAHGAGAVPGNSETTRAEITSGGWRENVENRAVHPSQDLLNFISSKYLQKVDPSTPEEFNGFVEYIERLRNALILDVKSGSLIVMVECSSLEILEGLWEDYSTGYLNKMAQRFLVTEELLRAFGLAEVKLTTTIKEEQYRACHKLLSKIAGSSSVSKSTQGKTNYSRLCRLLISIGSRVLRDTFDSIILPENLRELLKRDPAHSRLQLLRKKGVLSSVHWSKLYPAAPTEVSSASFDIPLLIVLLRTICNLSPPPAGWDTPPLTADASRESDIARIKYFMNAVSKHATEGSVSDAVFRSYWQHIRLTLVRLGGADYEDRIDEMKDQDIEFFDNEHFSELLKQWKRVEDDIKEKLNELETEEASKEEGRDSANAQTDVANSASQPTEGLIEHRGDFSYPTDVIEKIRQLYKTRERRLLPLPWLEDFSFHLDEIFTRLKIVGKEKTRGVLTDDTTNMTAIFKAHAECQRPRTVLIEGDPGMGKTTYCQKLAYDWATKQNEWDPSFPEIEVLLLLKCHEIKSDIWEAINDQILPEEMDDQAKEYFFKFIRENQSKVLLVLDGMDEADPSNLKMFFNLVEGKELSGCYVVLTSRHEVGKKVRRFCDTLWEIIGFNKEDAESFIHKYFKNINKELLAEKTIEMIWPPLYSVRSTDLHELAKNPLNTALLCVICEGFKGVFPTSRTQLYTEIVNYVLKRYENRHGLSSNNDNLLTVYKRDLFHLGKMALHSLRKGELFFEEHEFAEKLIALSKFGFLSLQAAGSKRKFRVRYAFLHKSFQEFFSGFYLACQIIEGDIDCDSVVTDEIYKVELNQVFYFMSGILASLSEENAESLVKSIAADINSISLNRADGPLSQRLLFALRCVSGYPRLVGTLGQSLNFTRLNFLDVGSINDSDVASLSQALAANSSLSKLRLYGFWIGNSGVASLSQALVKNSSLIHLDLSWNCVGGSGAESLSNALLENSSLTHLELKWNDIGNSGAESLSKALTKNSSLTHLDLRRNRIGDDGAVSLFQALAVNSSLISLDLMGNSVGDSSTASIFQALETNSTLNYLDLRANKFYSSGRAVLSSVCENNTTVYVRFDDYDYFESFEDCGDASCEDYADHCINCDFENDGDYCEISDHDSDDDHNDRQDFYDNGSDEEEYE